MICKLILWLFGAYFVKKFSLIDLRTVGALQGAMAIRSPVAEDTRASGVGGCGRSSPFGMKVGACVLPLLS